MPRWSPDGRRIVFVSNAGGNTGLEVVHLPGARREPVAIERRSYLRPTGTLALTITEGAARAVPARVSVVGSDGRSWAPDDAWRHADEAFVRGERRFESAYFHTPGRARLTVPADEELTVEVSRGPEYRIERRRVRVSPGRTEAVPIRLVRIANLAAQGWWSGDLHVHMNYGGHYRATPATLRAQAAAEDLHVVENLIVNKEGRVPDLAYFTGRPDPISTAAMLILHDEEYHTSFWGHTGLLGLRDHLLLPTYAAYQRTAAASAYPANPTVFDLARAQGAVTGYVHPFDAYPDPTDSAPLTHDLPVSVALGEVDYMEVMGFSDHLASARVWYQLLNCGFRIPAGAGTDAMTNFASLRGPVGTTRVYVKTNGPLSRDRFLAGLKAGRTMVTNGPLVSLQLAGRGPGSEIRLERSGARLPLRATLRSPVPVDHFELVANGEVVARFYPGADRMRAVVDTTILAEGSGWYTVRAWAERPVDPILDLYPFGTTGPVYVSLRGNPVHSPADAAYFVAWIDRLKAAADSQSDWNNPEERAEVLDQIARARAVFEAGSR
jgi:hypothetical protein